MVEIIRSKVILNFGYAAAIATEGYICALVDFAVKSKVGASIELDCPNPWFACLVHVFLNCWVEEDVPAQIQQWFHSSTAKMPFLQTATAYHLKIKNSPWEILALNVEPHKFTTKFFYGKSG